MLDLFLIIMLVISISKPDVLLSKKIKETANDEQKNILAKNLRKILGLMVATFECLALQRYVDNIFSTILLFVGIILLLLFFIFGIPAFKENKKIMKELK